jgi:ATP-dependent RNA helicase HelY
MARAGEAAAHPVAACPDAAAHLSALRRLEHERREAARIERLIRSRTESLARQFDRVLRVLEAWGYIDGWTLTESGERLTRIYHEADLLVAECVAHGAFDGLTPPEVAALASVFTYESRGPGPVAAPVFPTSRLRDRWQRVERTFAELTQMEREAALPLTRAPDPGFMELAHGWVAGEDLSRLLADDEVSGGDLVRNIKQLIDVLRQLAEVAPGSDARAAAATAADHAYRGVVAASSTVPGS